MKAIVLAAILLVPLLVLCQDSPKIKTQIITIHVDSFRKVLNKHDSLAFVNDRVEPMMARNKINDNGFAYSFTSETQSNLLSLSVLIFGFLLTVALMIWLYKMKKGIGNFAFKTLGIILILTACLFLIVAGYDVEQITPVIGLLGTIAGFIFGSSGNANNSNGPTTS